MPASRTQCRSCRWTGCGRTADLVVECAPAAICAISPSRPCPRPHVMMLSCGALLDDFDLVDLARRVSRPHPGADRGVIALDAVQAQAAEGGIARVHMVTRKPPAGLDGAPYLVEHQHRGRPAQRAETGVQRHRARGGARVSGEVNVAAALAMAGIGPDRTTIEIWADPASTATSTGSRSRPTPPVSRWRSRMCPRPKTPRPGG